jgi:hypothetical protein
MSVLNNSLLLGADAGGYTISRSLRFNSADSAYLSRTPASAGNRKTWTWAGWVKRSKLDENSEIFATGSSDGFVLRFGDVTGGNIIRVYSYVGSYQLHLKTSAVYRDTAAWYHLVLAVDTTQATEANRAKLYVNGVQVTALATALYPSQNADLLVNAAARHDIGSILVWGANSYFDGYLADIHFIDGQALTPTSFGEFSATTGVWMPKAYTGTYGTNGFRLTFADNSAATATTLGKDAAGSNNWTPNNLSVAAGAGNDSLVDVPVNGSEVDTGLGAQVRGNYCTWNPLDKNTSDVIENGNLDVELTGYRSLVGTFAVASGKWYWEVTQTGTSSAAASLMIGVADASASSASKTWQGANGWFYYTNGNKYNNNANTSYGSSFATNDVIGIALDMDAGAVVFYKNGTSQGTAFSGFSGKLIQPALSEGTLIYFQYASANFGQRPFAYTAPSGFKALCTANLPAPTITQPSTVMDVKLYTGNGSTQTISGLGFSPDLVWIKPRSAAYNNRLYDQVRGVENVLNSNTTAAEGSDGGGVTAFTSTGFTLGSSVSQNENNTTYAAWTWDAGSSTVTNTAGSISSQVRANASAGFSIVTFTANGTAGATVGHGLGAAPSFVIVKGRTSTANWLVYHAAIGNTNFLQLNTTIASTSSVTAWNNASPSSSVFTLGDSAAGNTSGAATVAYCVAPVAGYSAFGSYTGNGSTDGPFVYTGFRPRWVMFKSSSAGADWVIEDAARGAYNLIDARLFPNTNDAELSNGNGNIDFLSNGFKLRNAHSSMNASSTTYIYAAFAEAPFQYARAR